jgi:hypothetical protein
MKKNTILLLITTIMLSCSSDDNSSDSKSNSFSPPTWIQGKWIYKNDISTVGYTFKKDDVCQIVSGMENCLKQGIQIYEGTQIHTNVTEKKTDKDYEVSYTIGSQTFNFHFVKVSENQIKETINTPTANAVFTKQ